MGRREAKPGVVWTDSILQAQREATNGLGKTDVVADLDKSGSCGLMG